MMMTQKGKLLDALGDVIIRDASFCRELNDDDLHMQTNGMLAVRGKLLDALDVVIIRDASFCRELNDDDLEQRTQMFLFQSMVVVFKNTVCFLFDFRF